MKKLFILFILLLSVGICNVHAEGTAIHIDDRVIYGNTIVGYFETNEDYDTISFDVTMKRVKY